VRPDDHTEFQPNLDAPPVPAGKMSFPGEDRTESQPMAADTGANTPDRPPVDRTEPPAREPAPGVPRSDEVERTEALSAPGPDLTEGRTEIDGASSAAVLDAGAGRPPRVPGYEMLSHIGRGTFGEVWLAREERTGIQVAIKFFAHGAGTEWQLVQDEVKQLARLHADPGIVQLLDVELKAAPPYYVMAYAEGGSLAGRLEKGPLSVEQALPIFQRMAEALAYVHAKGIIHCDLKPGNILLDARQRVLIADFGQAHLSSDATPALGTFFYMAPEQADLAKRIPDTRWDVYGLGAIFHAMLTGRPPHEDARFRDELGNTVELSHRLRRYREWLQKAPRPDAHRRVPGVDRRLSDILDRCLEVDPGKRLPDAAAVLTALQRRERQLRQRPLLVFGFVAQVLLFLVMAGIATWAVESGIAQSEAALTEQLLRSDKVKASLVAGGLEEDLLSRKAILERYAGSRALKTATATRNREKLGELLISFEKLHAHKVLSWIVVDEKGHLLALKVGPDVTFPKDFKIPEGFAARDWFHGRGNHSDKKGAVFPPIRKTYLSQPFRRRFEKELGIGLSTPIFAPGSKDRIVGVLCAPIRLKDIHRWLDQAQMKNGFAVLVDRQGHCLLHRDENQIQPEPDQPPRRWSSPVFEAAVHEEGTTSFYEDPVDGRTYLAAYTPLRSLGWGAIVQDERGPALKPIADLKNRMLLLGGLMLLTVTALLSALWGWLIWSLRRKERVVQT
jgi:hypothetical protein